MLPQTHHLFIHRAIDDADGWAREFRRDIIQGNDDEDVHIVPFVKWRLRAAGLTHTHVPNGRFGELGFPSAKSQCMLFLEKARHERRPARAAWWIGRTCHLLGDVAVPARANRIWHIEGDPLEAWIEARVESFRDVVLPEIAKKAPEEIVEELARFAATFPADTTRTPWGRARFQWFDDGRKLDNEELAEQARLLVPLVIAYTKTLLQWVDRSR
jgi:hypothetical protein